MRQPDRALARGEPFDVLHRVGHELLDRDAVVGDAVHERGVRAVLEQPPHQVGEQRLVAAHRRVDAARPRQPALRTRRDDALVQRLAHAVQALELVLAGVIVLPRGVVDRGERVRVVGRELRVHRIGRGQELARAGQVRHVGVHLARVDRVALQAVDLGALDLAVPVRPLHEPHHQAPCTAPRQLDQVVEHQRAALLVGLHDEADAVPALQGGLGAQALEQVERDLEPVGLFGVDVQADVVAARQQRQLQQARVQLCERAFELRAAVARVQRRQLDRDARPFVDAAPRGGRADRVDRALVGLQVARRVGLGECRFAEHVVRIAEALALAAPGIAQRQLDGLAGDELVAHQAHRHVHALADQRLAALADGPRERAAQARFGMRCDQLAGDEQAPGGGVDEQRAALAEVRAPVGVADLVADQRVARRAVGNAQQGFGQAHQRHAFLRRQRELLDQPLHQPLAASAALAIAQRLRQLAGQGARRLGLHRRQARRVEQRRDALGLGPPVGRGDARPARRRCLHRAGEIEERRGHGAVLLSWASRSRSREAAVIPEAGCGPRT